MVQTPRSSRSRIATVPAWAWIVLGFLPAYLFFFVEPIFLNPQHVMQFPQYLMALDPIGADLRQMLEYATSWWRGGGSPYIGSNLYPPLATVMFTPLLVFDAATAFRLATIANLCVFLTLACATPLMLARHTDESRAAAAIFLLTGLVSYGFQFELERGQFNLIAMLFCTIAVILFHRVSRARLLAYALFTVAVQLKVYPAVFVVMLVDDWRDWKAVLNRFFGLGVVNAACLFALGTAVFRDFVVAIREQTINPYVWVGNHSIRSFADGYVEELRGASMFSAPGLQGLLLATVGLALLVIIWRTWRRGEPGPNPALFLACALVAMLLPSVSHDYKLAILPAPLGVAVVAIGRASTPRTQWLLPPTLVMIGYAYGTTLFSYVTKPSYLTRNNLPALLVILLLVTAWELLSNSTASSQIPPHASGGLRPDSA